jgi:hypothetical protein
LRRRKTARLGYLPEVTIRVDQRLERKKSKNGKKVGGKEKPIHDSTQLFI